MIAIDFSRAKAVCAVRYANFASDCCKSVASAPHLDYSARRADVAEGNDLGQRRRPTGSNPEPAPRPRKIRPWVCPSRRNHVTVHPGASRDPCHPAGAVRNWIPGLRMRHRDDASFPSLRRKREPSDSLCFRGSGNPVIPVVPAEAGTQWRSWGDRNDSKDTGSPLSRG